MNRVLGKNLKVGDVIAVWWGRKRETITGWRPYLGKVANGQARCADLSSGVGMTIFDDQSFTVYHREPEQRPAEARPDWSGECENCGASPILPMTGMCGPCTFGEADTAGGNW